MLVQSPNRSFSWPCLLVLALVYAAITLLIPPYFPMLQTDSTDYIQFSPDRTALYPLFLKGLAAAGLDLIAVTYVQVGLFSASLFVFLLSLARFGVPRVLVLLFVAGLCANVYFSSFHRVILTESLFCTVLMLCLAALLEFARSGNALFAALATFSMGLLVGIRPAAVGLVPVFFLLLWLKGRRSNVPTPVLLGLIILPFAVAALSERFAYRAYHGNQTNSLVGYLLMGRSAMLMRPDIVFTGPHAAIFADLGKKLWDSYEPVHRFLSGVPLPALPTFTAVYEGVAQRHLVQHEIAQASKMAGVPRDALLLEFFTQIVRTNIAGQARLFVINYIGQWSIASLTFPPTARAVNRYVADYPGVPLLTNDPADPVLHPKATRTSYLVYPVFLAAGVGTLVLSLALGPFLIRSSLAEDPRLRYLFIAALLSCASQSYAIFLSLTNSATPRYLMAIFPLLLLIFILCLCALWPQSMKHAPKGAAPEST